MNDFLQEDQEMLNDVSNREKFTITESTTTKPHRRHLHKHPYDRGPM